MQLDNPFDSFEKWLVKNHQWNGCGWINILLSHSVVKSTETLYAKYCESIFNPQNPTNEDGSWDKQNGFADLDDYPELREG